MTTDRSKDNPVTLLHPTKAIGQQDKATTPSGKLRMVITYLEMKKPKSYERESSRNENVSIIRAHEPLAGFYRYLYNTVGRDWLWYERNQLSDDQLESIIQNRKVKLYVLYVNGTPAGFGELDCRIDDEIELAYFGLIPQFIGRGFGSLFLRHLVQSAWTDEPKRVWVHTCNFDSPYAMVTYQKVGFSPYHQEEIFIDDPRMSESENSC